MKGDPDAGASATELVGRNQIDIESVPGLMGLEVERLTELVTRCTRAPAAGSHRYCNLYNFIA